MMLSLPAVRPGLMLQISAPVTLTSGCGCDVLQMPDMSARLISLSLEDSRNTRRRKPVILRLPNLRRLATSDRITSIGGEFPQLHELFLHGNFVHTSQHIIDNIFAQINQPAVSDIV
jgi:hypothetical protein